MKVSKVLITGAILIPIIIISYFIYPWILIFIGNFFHPNPPAPEIKYGEFPFRLEFEIDGKPMVIEDTLICEFDGFGSNEGEGKYRKWKQRLASGGVHIEEGVMVLKVEGAKEIHYPIGTADYYMGDMAQYLRFNFTFPNAILVDINGKYRESRIIKSEELFEDYRIKLLNWSATPPIINSFKK